jgi:predicted  nucleic acid-binding Zn-ribbon protein
MDETTKTDELQALTERVETLEDAVRYLHQRLTDVEQALLALHDRMATVEAALVKGRDIAEHVIQVIAVIMRRLGGGPPSGPVPLSGLN